MAIIATTFTFSCSSGDDDKEDNNGGGGSGMNLSDVPTQVYLGEENEYTGNGDVVLVFDSDTLPAGKIQNGKLILDLPQSLDSKYLDDMEEVCTSEDCDASNFSYTKDVYWTEVRPIVITPERTGRLRLRTINYGGDFGVWYFFFFFYWKGTIKYEEETATYDVNFSKGWNIIYIYPGGNGLIMITNIPQEIKDNLLWAL
jgi:hypothetical protein